MLWKHYEILLCLCVCIYILTKAFVFYYAYEKALIFFFFFRILNIFNTHTGWEKNVFLKKFTVLYIQNGLTLVYTAHILNLYLNKKRKREIPSLRYLCVIIYIHIYKIGYIIFFFFKYRKIICCLSNISGCDSPFEIMLLIAISHFNSLRLYSLCSI